MIYSNHLFLYTLLHRLWVRWIQLFKMMHVRSSSKAKAFILFYILYRFIEKLILLGRRVCPKTHSLTLTERCDYSTQMLQIWNFLKEFHLLRIMHKFLYKKYLKMILTNDNITFSPNVSKDTRLSFLNP